MKVRALLVAGCVLAAAATDAAAQPDRPIELDRVAIRFEAPDLGGPARPRFVFERELAFEARIEALADVKRGFSVIGAYEERHVRMAMERHVTEEILRSLPVEPPVTKDDVRRTMITARLALDQRVGGHDRLLGAATAEGMESGDLDALIEREARAALYLDRMVTPMLNPSDAELREAQRTEATPFRGYRYEDVAPLLRRWYVQERLAVALAAFFQGARARIRIYVVPKQRVPKPAALAGSTPSMRSTGLPPADAAPARFDVASTLLGLRDLGIRKPS